MDETAERLEKRIDRVDDRTHADYRQLVKDISEVKTAVSELTTAVSVLGVKLDERSAPRRLVLQKAAGGYTKGDRPEGSPEPR